MSFSVSFVVWIEAPQFQAHAVLLQSGVDPTRGVAIMKNISHRRQVDEVNATGILRDLPMMRVAINIGLHLFARSNNLQERERIFQSHVTAIQPGVVMH